ncbi:MAG: hypothetical protein WA715_04680 [Candidatus Acidiferrum sp.]
MLSLMPKPPVGDARRISEILARGVAHHTAGELGAAEACYREILRLEPAHPDASHLLGVAAALQGLDDYDGAAELLQRGVALNRTSQKRTEIGAAISGGRATWLARWNRAAERSISIPISQARMATWATRYSIKATIAARSNATIKPLR